MMQPADGASRDLACNRRQFVPERLDLQNFREEPVAADVVPVSSMDLGPDETADPSRFLQDDRPDAPLHQFVTGRQTRRPRPDDDDGKVVLDRHVSDSYTPPVGWSGDTANEIETGRDAPSPRRLSRWIFQRLVSRDILRKPKVAISFKQIRGRPYHVSRNERQANLRERVMGLPVYAFFECEVSGLASPRSFGSSSGEDRANPPVAKTSDQVHNTLDGSATFALVAPWMWPRPR